MDDLKVGRRDGLLVDAHVQVLVLEGMVGNPHKVPGGEGAGERALGRGVVVGQQGQVHVGAENVHDNLRVGGHLAAAVVAPPAVQVGVTAIRGDVETPRAAVTGVPAVGREAPAPSQFADALLHVVRRRASGDVQEHVQRDALPVLVRHHGQTKLFGLGSVAQAPEQPPLHPEPLRSGRRLGFGDVRQGEAGQLYPFPDPLAALLYGLGQRLENTAAEPDL
mmetsp:Transcript_2712/g.7468  ORF Transcript_2712/g.7468 Transcript_2712/m.7468 type:complete len:221 (-) Transcript_2712:373-1035(-)